jgi:hypothetical protein
MEPHQFAVLKLVNTKLNYVLEILNLMVEVMAAAGDPAQVRSIAEKIQASTTELQSAVREAVNTTGEIA